MVKPIKIILFLFLLATVYGLSTASFAEVPRLITYQGRLTDNSDKPLTGTHDITFRLYDAPEAGNLLWTEKHSTVNISSGLFNIMLGSVTLLNLDFDKPYYLSIQVDTDPEMSPRQQLTSAGYAIRANRAENANNADAVGGIGTATTPTANKILPLDNNAKLPAVALKTYDSGWFNISSSGQYILSHNMGTDKVILSIYVKNLATGKSCLLTRTYEMDKWSTLLGAGIFVYPDQIKICTSNTEALVIDETNASIASCADQMRIIALALE